MSAAVIALGGSGPITGTLRPPAMPTATPYQLRLPAAPIVVVQIPAGCRSPLLRWDHPHLIGRDPRAEARGTHGPGVHHLLAVRRADLVLDLAATRPGRPALRLGDIPLPCAVPSAQGPEGIEERLSRYLVLDADLPVRQAQQVADRAIPPALLPPEVLDLPHPAEDPRAAWHAVVEGSAQAACLAHRDRIHAVRLRTDATLPNNSTYDVVGWDLRHHQAFLRRLQIRIPVAVDAIDWVATANENGVPASAPRCFRMTPAPRTGPTDRARAGAGPDPLASP